MTIISEKKKTPSCSYEKIQNSSPVCWTPVCDKHKLSTDFITKNKLLHLCGILSKNGPHRLKYLNAYLPGVTLFEKIRRVRKFALMEEVLSLEIGLRFQKPILSLESLSVPTDQDIALGYCYSVCLHATKLNTAIMIKY